jgi:hypothetical protein
MRHQASDDELGGLHDVAAWLGVSLSAVKTLRYRHHRPPKAPMEHSDQRLEFTDLLVIRTV